MKTAVEFYRTELNALVSGRKTEYKTESEIFEKALEMEKNHKTQIIKDYFEWHKSKGFVSHKITDIEDFCNETFKSE